MTTQLATLSTFASTSAELFQRLRLRWATARQPLQADEAGNPADHTARDAANVRALADRYQRTDPGFARDLYAAADRHERALEATAAR